LIWFFQPVYFENVLILGGLASDICIIKGKEKKYTQIRKAIEENEK